MNRDVNFLLNKLQENKPEKVKQLVSQVKKGKNEGRVQCSFYIDLDLKRRLKLKALEEDRTIRELISDGIEEYLKQN